MIIGVILTILLLVMVPLVLRVMKVPKYDVYTPVNVFSRAGELINGLFNLGNIVKQSQESSQYKGQIFDTLDSSNSQGPQPITNDSYNL